LVLKVDSFDTADNKIYLRLDGIVTGKAYKLVQSAELDAGFTDTGVTVTDATEQPFSVTANEESSPKQFYKAEVLE